MKLLSCHIENFGKLSDFAYRFEDGLNMLFSENGWGKSTLAAFLGVMFYGFDGENKRTEESNERMRYRPWQGGTYGGSVTFACRDRTYRMLRVFGSRKKDDVFSLFDDETGLSSDAFSERIGEEIFGIDRESFRRTVFWSQQDHETAATTLIQAKIGDLTAEQADLPAYDTAMKLLQKQAERLRPDRASGLIRKNEERLRTLEADEVRLPLLTAELEKAGRREAALESELRDIRREREAFVIRASVLPDAAGPDSPRERPDSGLILLKSREEACRSRILLLGEESRRISLRGRKELARLREVRRALREEKKEEADQREKKRAAARAVSFVCLVALLAILILVIAKVLPVFLLPVALLPAAIGVASFAGLLPDRAQDSPTAGHLRGEEKELRASLASLSTRLDRTKEELEKERALYADLRAQVRRKQKDPHANEAQVRLTQKESLENQAQTPAPGQAVLNTAEFDVREEDCRQRLSEAQRKSGELKERISRCEDSVRLLPGLREELRVLRERYDTCTMTIRYLQEARNSFNARYMNPFLRSFARYFSMLTGESAEAVRTDADFSISVMSGGLPRDPSLMSEGTKDLISLCRRMAMIDAMYPGEKPFLVLDDPFSNLDDERVKGGLRFLRSASLEYQILYLTCHRSRM